jgi:hypothetical protein
MPMKKTRLAVPALIGIIALSLPLRAQFTADEIAQRAQWEAFLAEARIVKAEAIGEGVTKPFKLTLEKDGVQKAGVWKGVNEKLGGGVLDSWKYEIAAYRLDKLIGLNMVPPVVERVYRKKSGGLVLWVDFKTSLLEVMEEGGRFPTRIVGQLPAWNDIYYIWGSLIANDDPTQQNIRYTADWRMILIDHSRAFRSDKLYTERLIFGANGIKRWGSDGAPFLFTGLPRALYEKIKALDFESVKQAVGPYLTDKEIDALLARKKLLLAEIDGLIKRDGEDKVLR